MPLSEEEQRILHEMEQSLYEQDRAFVDRVRADGPRSAGNRSLRWSLLAFVGGFAVLVLSFRSSVLVATCGFLVMLFSSFVAERSVRIVRSVRRDPARVEPEQRDAAGGLHRLGKRVSSRLRRER